MPTTYHKDTVCKKCGSYLYFFESTYVPEGDPKKYMAACQICGNVVYQGGDKKQATNVLSSHIVNHHNQEDVGSCSRTVVSAPERTMLINDGTGKMVPATMGNAYQINKTREVCICCGKKTYECPVFTGSVRYCDCVNKLPR